MMHRVTLLLGCNIGDREATLRRATDLLKERVGEIVGRSKIYSTRAWGFQSEELFANQAVVLHTELEPEPLLDSTQSIEQELGRDRAKEREIKNLSGERYCSRTMDIDIMFYDDEVIATPRLTIPHPLMQEREFALEPMCELEGERLHPRLNKTLNELYNELRNKQI